METHYSTGQKWKGKSCGSQEKNLLQESSAPLKATATTALLNECCKWECECWGLGEGSWPSNHSCHRQRIPSFQAEQCPPYPWIWLWAASVCPEVSIGMPILRVLTLQTPPEPLLLRLFHQPAHLSLWILPYRTASRKDSSRSLCLRMKLSLIGMVPFLANGTMGGRKWHQASQWDDANHQPWQTWHDWRLYNMNLLSQPKIVYISHIYTQ